MPDTSVVPPGPDLRILPRGGLTPKISDLIAMLEYTRQTTLAAAQNLTTSQLDVHHGPQGNSIGSLLAHIAAVEWAYSIPTFEGRSPTHAEKAVWGPALRLGAEARRVYHGRELAEYLALLDGVRQHTLRQLARRDDAWLTEEWTLSDGSLVNHHWAWFHVFEDELSHRGQMLMLRNHFLN